MGLIFVNVVTHFHSFAVMAAIVAFCEFNKNQYALPVVLAHPTISFYWNEKRCHLLLRGRNHYSVASALGTLALLGHVVPSFFPVLHICVFCQKVIGSRGVSFVVMPGKEFIFIAAGMAVTSRLGRRNACHGEDRTQTGFAFPVIIAQCPKFIRLAIPRDTNF